MMVGLPNEGRFVGRVWRPGIGPALVERQGDRLVDVTSAAVPTMRDLLELDDPVAWLDAQPGEHIGMLADFSVTAAGEDASGAPRRGSIVCDRR